MKSPLFSIVLFLFVSTSLYANKIDCKKILANDAAGGQKKKIVTKGKTVSSKELVTSLLDNFNSWDSLPELKPSEKRLIIGDAKENLKKVKKFSKGYSISYYWYEYKSEKYIFVFFGNDGGNGASLYSRDGKVLAFETISESGEFTVEEMLKGAN